MSSAPPLPKDNSELQSLRFTVWPVDQKAIAPIYSKNKRAVGLQKGLLPSNVKSVSAHWVVS